MKAGLYARVFTSDKGQDPDLQLVPMRAYCDARGFQIVDEYVDIASGSKDTRPALTRLLDDARKRRIDCIIVWKLDRFGRSLKHLVNTLEELGNLGIIFISHQENIDLSTPSGRLMMHIIAAMAEFERELIREGVRFGIANARAKGKRHGRKAIAPVELKKIIDIYVAEGLSVRAIARKVKMPPATVHRTIKNYKAGIIDGDAMLTKMV